MSTTNKKKIKQKQRKHDPAVIEAALNDIEKQSLPDYTKLEAASSQREHTSTIFEGVDQRGYKEASCQTQPLFTINRGCQTTPVTNVTTSKEREHIYKLKGSLCDLVLHYKGYANLLQQYLSVPFTGTCPSKEFQKEQLQHLDEASSQTQTTPSESTHRTSAISPAMMTQKFYPERRPGKGPKKIRNTMDRIYSISSMKMIEERKRLKEEKDKKEQGLKRKPKAIGRKGSVTKRTKKQVERETRDEDDIPPDISEDKEPQGVTKAEAGTSGVSRASGSSNEELMSLHDSSDESLHDEIDNFASGITLEEPKVDSWVGVKVEKVKSSSKGRRIIPYEVYIARVIKVDEGGFEVSFLREKCDGFYIMPEIEELSYPHHQDEIVVLESPQRVYRNRIYGFSFPSSIKSLLISYFKSK